MPEFLTEPPPEEWDPAWMRRALERIQRAIAPTLTPYRTQRVELNSDAGYVPLLRAPYPLAIRRVSIWSPIAVEPRADLYTILDVRNKDRNVSLLAAEGGFSTSGGLLQWQWRDIAVFDATGEAHGPDMEMDRNETLWITWEHYRQAPGAATTTGLSTEMRSETPPTLPDTDPPAETGALLVELWVAVETERS